jgi:hypothetical protein
MLLEEEKTEKKNEKQYEVVYKNNFVENLYESEIQYRLMSPGFKNIFMGLHVGDSMYDYDNQMTYKRLK